MTKEEIKQALVKKMPEMRWYNIYPNKRDDLLPGMNYNQWAEQIGCPNAQYRDISSVLSELRQAELPSVLHKRKTGKNGKPVDLYWWCPEKAYYLKEFQSKLLAVYGADLPARRAQMICRLIEKVIRQYPDQDLGKRQIQELIIKQTGGIKRPYVDIALEFGVEIGFLTVETAANRKTVYRVNGYNQSRFSATITQQNYQEFFGQLAMPTSVPQVYPKCTPSVP